MNTLTAIRTFAKPGYSPAKRTRIDGAHVLGEDGLRDYHAAAKVRDACRIRSCNERFAKIKHALHPYRVVVSLLSSDPIQIRVYRADTQRELILL